MESNNYSRGENSSVTTPSDEWVTRTTNAMKAIYWIIGSFGLLSNIYVITVILLNRTMLRQTTNILIVNQSCIDLTVAVFLIFTTIFEDNEKRKTPGNTAEELLCRLWYPKMPLWGTLLSSTYSIVALTLEKFSAVTFPIWHKTRFVSSRVLIGAMVFAPWLFGPTFYVCLVIPTAMIKPNGHCVVYSVWPGVETRRAVGIVTVFIQFLIPLVILVYCYLRMALILHRKIDKVHETSKKKGEPKRNETMARARANVIRTLILVGVSFILCWSWNQVYYLLFHLGSYGIHLTGILYNLTVIMVFLNSCVNPIIYTCCYKQFQNGIRRLVCRGRVDHEPSVAIAASNSS